MAPAGSNSEDEDYDELPPITVNSSGRDSSMFSVPCAAAVAAERARELRCEAELAQLRAGHLPGSAGGVLPHSDSSGSESEAALAAAVTALQVVGRAKRAPPPRLHALLPAAVRRLPPGARPFLLEYARVAAALPPTGADRLARLTLARLESWLAGSPPPTEEERCACGAWLCLAAAAAERVALGAAGLRAAHRLLEEGVGVGVVDALLESVEEPRACLSLADVLRGGGGARGAEVADALVRGTLARLLPGVGADDVAARWRHLAAHDRYTVLQLAARARLHHTHTDESAVHLLDALTAAPHHTRDNTTDNLKVLVAASKMQVLFPARK